MKKNLDYIALVPLVIVASLLTVSAQGSDSFRCQLSESNNGKEVSVRGTVVSSPHDFILFVSGCEDVVVLEFSGVKGASASTIGLQSRKNLSLLKLYGSMEAKCPPGKVCSERPLYKVDAILIGRLDVGTVPDGYWKDGLGYLHDQSGKITGKFGFGHPPTYKYRLVIKDVSKVVARRRHWRKKQQRESAY